MRSTSEEKKKGKNIHKLRQNTHNTQNSLYVKCKAKLLIISFWHSTLKLSLKRLLLLFIRSGQVIGHWVLSSHHHQHWPIELWLLFHTLQHLPISFHHHHRFVCLDAFSFILSFVFSDYSVPHTSKSLLNSHTHRVQEPKVYSLWFFALFTQVYFTFLFLLLLATTTIETRISSDRLKKQRREKSATQKFFENKCFLFFRQKSLAGSSLWRDAPPMKNSEWRKRGIHFGFAPSQSASVLNLPSTFSLLFCCCWRWAPLKPTKSLPISLVIFSVAAVAAATAHKRKAWIIFAPSKQQHQQQQHLFSILFTVFLMAASLESVFCCRCRHYNYDDDDDDDGGKMKMNVAFAVSTTTTTTGGHHLWCKCLVSTIFPFQPNIWCHILQMQLFLPTLNRKDTTLFNSPQTASRIFFVIWSSSSSSVKRRSNSDTTTLPGSCLHSLPRFAF